MSRFCPARSDNVALLYTVYSSASMLVNTLQFETNTCLGSILFGLTKLHCRKTMVLVQWLTHCGLSLIDVSIGSVLTLLLHPSYRYIYIYISISVSIYISIYPHKHSHTIVLSYLDFSHGKVGCFPQGKQQQSRTTQLLLHAWCFSVSITYRTLTWTTGSLTCAPMLLHVITHMDVRTP